jgi:hypothetical protein
MKRMLLVLLLGTVSILESAWSADITQLPIGYLKASDDSNGTVTVEARCVPAKEIIEAAAKQSDLAVTFEVPVFHYASVACKTFSPKEGESLGAVIRSVGLKASQDKQGWHVWGTRSPGGRESEIYKLSPEEILSQYKHVVEPKTPNDGISNGSILIYNGHFVPPPYQVVASIHPKTIDVSINGLEISHLRNPEKEVAYSPSPVEPRDFPTKDSLIKYALHSLYPLLLHNHPPKECVTQVVEFLKKQPLVLDVVNPEGKDPHGIAVVFKDFPDIPFPLFPGNYDFDTGFSKVRYTAKEVQDVKKEYWEHDLSDPQSIVLVSPGHAVQKVNRGDFLNRAHLMADNGTLSLLQIICLWSEIMDRDLAADLAVNNKDTIGSLIEPISGKSGDKQQ